METVNQILLVDNQVTSNLLSDTKIKKSGIAYKVKIALNGGHALLYLEQIQDKLIDSKLVIILNMDTPIMNGYEFINSYRACKNLCRENILLIVINDNLSEERMNMVKNLGVSNFIKRDFDTQILNGIIRNHFAKAPASVKIKNKMNNINHLPRMRAA